MEFTRKLLKAARLLVLEVQMAIIRGGVFEVDSYFKLI